MAGNYYARHGLEMQVDKMSDGDVNFLAIVKLMNMNAPHCIKLKVAQVRLKDGERGGWLL